MKKKVVGMMLLAIMVFSTFVGCGSSYDKAAESSYADVSEEYVETDSFDGDGFDYYSSGSVELADISSSELAEAPAAEVDSSQGTDNGTLESASAENTDAGTSAGAREEGTVGDTAVSTRKIVYTADLTINTKKYDEDINTIRNLVKKTGSYVESSNMSGTADSNDREASFTVRVPVDNYSMFMESAGGVGVVVSRNESADDITSSYVDVQARLKSLKNKKARLEEFEAQATKLDDILEFEEQINEVQYEIERYTATLNTYKDITSNCTINIYVYEVKEYVPVEDDDPTFVDRISETFGESLGVLLALLQGIVIVIVFIFPFAILAAIVLAIVLFIRKKMPKNEKAPKTEKAPKALQQSKDAKEEVQTSDVKSESQPAKNGKAQAYNGPDYSSSQD